MTKYPNSRLQVTIFLIVAALLVLGAIALPQTQQPLQTTPRTFWCADLDAIKRARDYARTHDYTTIYANPAFVYVLDEDLLIQGRGTIFDGNNARFIVNSHYPAGGNGIRINPTFKDPVKWANQQNGVWANPHGTVNTLNAALGGTPDDYSEAAPIQYAIPGSQPLASYSEFWEVITPADEISVRNVRLEIKDPQAMATLHARYCRKLNLSNITATTKGFLIVGCDNVVVNGCNAPVIGFNSCIFGRASNNVADNIGCEEACRFCDFFNNTAKTARIAGITSTDIRLLRNTFINSPWDGSIHAGGTRVTISGNICSAGVHLDGNARNCVVDGNVGTGWEDDSKQGTVETNNSWQVVK